MKFIQRVLNRRSHYRHVFQSSKASGDFVLADLRRFCRAGEPAIVLSKDGATDVYATGMVAGRQEVFWRIVHHLNLDDAQLIKLKETYDDDDQ